MAPSGRIASIPSIAQPGPDFSLDPYITLDISESSVSSSQPFFSKSKICSQEAEDVEDASEKSSSIFYTALKIAESLWLNPATSISDQMIQKVNIAADYLQNKGFKLGC